MALPFRRRSHTSQRAGNAPLCSLPSPAVRAWRVAVLLWPLSVEVQGALALWLLAPTDLNRWPPPETFTRQCAPFRWEDLHGLSVAALRRLLYEELKVIRQTLDFPPEAFSGLTLNGLLSAHATRLRQLEWCLGHRRAASLISEMIVFPSRERVVVKHSSRCVSPGGKLPAQAEEVK